MHPHLMGHLARQRQEELAGEARAAQRARHARRAGALTGAEAPRSALREVIDLRLVAIGWRLLEIGMARSGEPGAPSLQRRDDLAG
jgi:hypothetical protein